MFSTIDIIIILVGNIIFIILMNIIVTSNCALYIYCYIMFVNFNNTFYFTF